jgi:hypothetical protein
MPPRCSRLQTTEETRETAGLFGMVFFQPRFGAGGAARGLPLCLSRIKGFDLSLMVLTHRFLALALPLSRSHGQCLYRVLTAVGQCLDRQSAEALLRLLAETEMREWRTGQTSLRQPPKAFEAAFRQRRVSNSLFPSIIDPIFFPSRSVSGS